MISFNDFCPACDLEVDFQIFAPSIYREDLAYLKDMAGEKAGDIHGEAPELYGHMHLECPNCQKGFFAHFNMYLHTLLMELQRKFPEIYEQDGEFSDEEFFSMLEGDLRRFAVNQSVSLLPETE